MGCVGVPPHLLQVRQLTGCFASPATLSRRCPPGVVCALHGCVAMPRRPGHRCATAHLHRVCTVGAGVRFVAAAAGDGPARGPATLSVLLCGCVSDCAVAVIRRPRLGFSAACAVYLIVLSCSLLRRCTPTRGACRLRVCSLVTVPYRLAFNSPATGASWIVDMLVNALFAVDIVLCFITAVTDKRTNELIYEPRLIAVQYLRGWFLLDVLSTFPFDEFFQGGQLRILRILRVSRLLKLLRVLRLKRLPRSVEALEEKLGLNPSIYRLVGLLSKIVAMGHLISCFFFFIAKTVSDQDRHGFLERTVAFDNDLTVVEAPPRDQYMIVLYWTFVTVFGVGFGDYVPVATLERAVSVAIMLVGSCFVGLIIGSMVTILSDENKERSDRMNAVKLYMSDFEVPTALRRQILRFYTYMFSKKSPLTDVSDRVRVCAFVCVCVCVCMCAGYPPCSRRVPRCAASRCRHCARSTHSPALFCFVMMVCLCNRMRVCVARCTVAVDGARVCARARPRGRARARARGVVLTPLTSFLSPCAQASLNELPQELNVPMLEHLNPAMTKIALFREEDRAFASFVMPCLVPLFHDPDTTVYSEVRRC